MPEDRGMARWAGRNPDKDVVRDEIWRNLEQTGTAVGPAWSNIPNFVGADVAAWRLSQTPEWKAAKTVKCNPDPPQIPVRLRALYDGKLLFAPVPYLTKSTPYIRIDPEKLRARGIDFETAATAQGFMAYGEPVEFEEVEPLDFCVVGSVAVARDGGRTGKGAGFADLETGIFRELGKISSETPLATTVHSSQLVQAARVPMMAHDSPLHYVATEQELIATRTAHPVPKGVEWSAVSADQFEQIPFLAQLRDRMLASKTAGAIAPAVPRPVVPVDLPDVKAEVEAAFAEYERALVANDVAVLDALFLDAPTTLRYGIGENLYGFGEIAAFRAARPSAGLARTLERTVITTYGRDVATAWTLFRRASLPGKIGRQSQVWLRTPTGWRVVAAHVSVIADA